MKIFALKWMKTLYAASTVFIVFGVLAVLATIWMGGTSINQALRLDYLLKLLAPGLPATLFGIAGLLGTLANLVGVYEVLKSEKKTGWKITWTLILLVLGVVGFIAYVVKGRKEIKDRINLLGGLGLAASKNQEK